MAVHRAPNIYLDANLEFCKVVLDKFLRIQQISREAKPDGRIAREMVDKTLEDELADIVISNELDAVDDATTDRALTQGGKDTMREIFGSDSDTNQDEDELRAPTHAFFAATVGICYLTRTLGRSTQENRWINTAQLNGKIEHWYRTFTGSLVGHR